MIPHVKVLLLAKDPVPFYVLKLLNLLVDQNNLVFVPALKKAELVEDIFNYFQLEHPRLTKNTLCIIVQYIISHEL